MLQQSASHMNTRLSEFLHSLASYQWDNHDDGMYRLMQYGTHNLSLLRGLEAAFAFMRMILKMCRILKRPPRDQHVFFS